MLRCELTSQLWMAFHILSITVSLRGSSTSQTSGPSNMMCESTPHALYDTSIPSALLSSRLLSERETNMWRTGVIRTQSFHLKSFHQSLKMPKCFSSTKHCNRFWNRRSHTKKHGCYSEIVALKGGIGFESQHVYVLTVFRTERSAQAALALRHLCQCCFSYWLAAEVLLPEDCDELRSEQLWPQCFDLGDVS